ncbi:MAG: hypothetical protein OHK0019_13190 [Saprospiraceae bacterium]
MKKILVIQLLLILLAACEKSALTDGSESVARPVVEAYLQPGQNPAVKITRQILFGGSDTVALPIKGLSVVIENGDFAYSLALEGDTIYVGDGSWQPEAGKTYRLKFTYESSDVTAETLVPEKPMGFTASASSIEIPSFDIGGGGGFPTFPDPIELTWQAEPNAYYLVVVENLEPDPEPIFDIPDGDDRPRPTFRSEPEQKSSYEIGFQSFQYYGTHRVILYRLNAEYAALYDDNGNSSQNLTTPYTNVVGGLGIFTGMNADTLTVEVKE